MNRRINLMSAKRCISDIARRWHHSREGPKAEIGRPRARLESGAVRAAERLRRFCLSTLGALEVSLKDIDYVELKLRGEFHAFDVLARHGASQPLLDLCSQIADAGVADVLCQRRPIAVRVLRRGF